jgi:hypothetical protein
MTTMPRINDRMIEEFRRTGKRRSSYAMAMASNSSRVVAQAHCPPCAEDRVGQRCGANCAGICCPDLSCSLTGSC